MLQYYVLEGVNVKNFDVQWNRLNLKVDEADVSKLHQVCLFLLDYS